MPWGLTRFHDSGQSHFVTFCCYHRSRLFRTDASCRIFESALERVRRSYRLYVYGYAVMPDHVHLLLSEPQREGGPFKPGFGERTAKPRPPKVGSEVNRIRARGPRATLAYHSMFVRVSALIMEECGQVCRDCRWLLSWGEVPATWKNRPALDVVHALQI
jgi:hypothetical protein